MKISLLPEEQVRVEKPAKGHRAKRSSTAPPSKGQALQAGAASDRLRQIIDAITQSRRERLARQQQAQQDLAPPGPVTGRISPSESAQAVQPTDTKYRTQKETQQG